MKSLRFLFGLWMVLLSCILLTDMLSYSRLLFTEDWFQFSNREMNTFFIFIFIYIPYLISTVATCRYINELNEE